MKKQEKNSSNESSKGQKRILEYFSPESKAVFDDPTARQARVVDDMRRTSRTPFPTAVLPHVKQILTGLQENGIQFLQYQDGDSYANKIACRDRNGQIFSLLLGHLFITEVSVHRPCCAKHCTRKQ